MDMLTTTARQLLLFGHTLAFAFAIVAVFREDVALLRARRVDADKLEATGRTIARLLGLLWLTGAALILLDGVDQAVVSPAAISITAMAAGRSRSNCSGLDEAD